MPILIFLLLMLFKPMRMIFGALLFALALFLTLMMLHS